ncbi:MAG: iron-sulfur cluster assembly accessory protein [Betaproteobacteria bacterium]|nr:iron-sulfur cluster assembly accessory protein [Betaproteobacteria bacterium]
MAVTLTSAAAQQVRQALSKRGKGIGLRVSVKQSGCSGLAYVIDYADEALPTDAHFETEGVLVLVNTEHLQYLDGTELDYRREGLNAAFKFNNPNVADACGCGESFTTRQA